jgi:uncharacterized protein YybS (DUF2232 family)
MNLQEPNSFVLLSTIISFPSFTDCFIVFDAWRKKKKEIKETLKLKMMKFPDFFIILS